MVPYSLSLIESSDGQKEMPSLTYWFREIFETFHNLPSHPKVTYPHFVDTFLMEYSHQKVSVSFTDEERFDLQLEWCEFQGIVRKYQTKVTTFLKLDTFSEDDSKKLIRRYLNSRACKYKEPRSRPSRSLFIPFNLTRHEEIVEEITTLINNFRAFDYTFTTQSTYDLLQWNFKGPIKCITNVKAAFILGVLSECNMMRRNWAAYFGGNGHIISSRDPHMPLSAKRLHNLYTKGKDFSEEEIDHPDYHRLYKCLKDLKRLLQGKR